MQHLTCRVMQDIPQHHTMQHIPHAPHHRPGESALASRHSSAEAQLRRTGGAPVHDTRGAEQIRHMEGPRGLMGKHRHSKSHIHELVRPAHDGVQVHGKHSVQVSGTSPGLRYKAQACRTRVAHRCGIDVMVYIPYVDMAHATYTGESLCTSTGQSGPALAAATACDGGRRLQPAKEQRPQWAQKQTESREKSHDQKQSA